MHRKYIRWIARDRFVKFLNCFFPVPLPAIHPRFEPEHLGTIGQATFGNRQLLPYSLVVRIAVTEIELESIGQADLRKVWLQAQRFGYCGVAHCAPLWAWIAENKEGREFAQMRNRPM